MSDNDDTQPGLRAAKARIEGLRDHVAAETWVRPEGKRAILTGISLALAAIASQVLEP